MIENQIKILSDVEHVKKRPQMYIGSISLEEKELFINGTYTVLKYVPAIIKLIEEIRDNSIDEAIRTNFKYANKIDVTIDTFINRVTVKDNGRGIPQAEVLTPEGTSIPGPVVAWTRTKSGGNFGNDADRVTAGTNGVGSSLTNIFSKEFNAITSDGKNTLELNCSDGMDKIDWNIKKGGKHGTEVSFIPDFSAFDCDHLDKTISDIIEDQIKTLAVIYPLIKFTFNGQLVKGSFKNYVLQYSDSAIINETENYSLGICHSPEGFRHITYVNSIHTKVGGNHIDCVIEDISSELIPQIKKKHKIEVSRSRIKDCLTLVFFIRNMKNLRFDSQTKERLTSPHGEIRSHLNFDFKKIAKLIMSNDDILMPIIESALAKKLAQENREATLALKKAQKKNILGHIQATSKNIEEKTIFIAEGQSASGIGISVRDPKYHGFYALRGKVMNTFEMKDADIAKNKELSELLTIIGLDLSDILINDPDELFSIKLDDCEYIVGKYDIIIHNGVKIFAKDYI